LLSQNTLTHTSPRQQSDPPSAINLDLQSTRISLPLLLHLLQQGWTSSLHPRVTSRSTPPRPLTSSTRPPQGRHPHHTG
ncbi:unnamed protein product, partial [Choristocarpus tenellus]